MTVFILMLISISILVFVQIYFSKNSNKLLGLILPIACFTLSITTILNVTIDNISQQQEQQLQVLEENSENIENIENSENSENAEDNLNITPSTQENIFASLIYLNIPTVLLLIVYIACRQYVKKNNLNNLI